MTWLINRLRRLLGGRETFPEQPTLDARWKVLERQQEQQVAVLKAEQRGPWAPAAKLAKPRRRKVAAVLPMRRRA